MARLKIYCSTCGKPAEYDLNKPKFCFQCGRSYASGFNTDPKEETAAKEEVKESGGEKLPKINKLEIDTIFYTPQRISIKDLAKYPGVPSKRIHASPPERSSKDILEEFKREAGSLRKKNEP